HHLLEALWVSWGLNRVDSVLLHQLLEAQDYRIRAAAVEVLRHTGHQIADQAELLVKAAGDTEGRVRLQAIAAASWLEKEKGLRVLAEAEKHSIDEWMRPAFETALRHLKEESNLTEKQEEVHTTLEGEDRD